MNAVHILTTGMHCGACPPRIEAAIEHLPGVKAARAFRELQLTSVLFDPEIVNAEDIRARVADIGFGAEVLVGGKAR
ncbi:MAG: heavy-metal-associated domain-containing protein [Coriobacteriia bacterium]